MHRLVRDHLEKVLSESAIDSAAKAHLGECEECRAELAAMGEQAKALRQLRASTADLEPRPGFYARVMERIEAQGPRSIWTLFFESPFGRRIAFASMALALFLGIFLVTSEQTVEPFNAANDPVEMIAGEDQPGLVLTNQGTLDRGSVLMNLATYQER